MSSAKRSVTASIVAFLLIGAGAVSVWLVAGSDVFASAPLSLDGPLPAVTATVPGGDGAESDLPLASGFQVSQPRDPFEPLTSEPPLTTTTLPGQTTTTLPGQTTTTLPGQTTTTVAGQTTTTTEGFEPAGTRVVLLEIREEDGVRKAVLTVDGVTHVAAVGETFGGQFKVVSLSEESGVFLYGDSAFTLAVGQAILK
jgi:hypothetical protein